MNLAGHQPPLRKLGLDDIVVIARQLLRADKDNNFVSALARASTPEGKREGWRRIGQFVLKAAELFSHDHRAYQAFLNAGGLASVDPTTLAEAAQVAQRWDEVQKHCRSETFPKTILKRIAKLAPA
jgi:hypothetical protein